MFQTGLMPAPFFFFFQRVLLAVSGAGRTISESSTFLHERVSGANAYMSSKKSKYGSNMQVHVCLIYIDR